MTNKQTNKQTLIVSVLSLVLCMSMLVGSTFAWFTDNATTGVNTIVAGNLDIGLYKGTVENGAISYTEVVDDSTLLFNNDALWEPGYTEVAYLKVDNIGTLALKALLTVNFAKQKIGTTADGNPIKLSDHLMYDIIEINEGAFYASRAEARAAAQAEAKKIATEQNEIHLVPQNHTTGESTKYYALVVYMPETVGNEANYRNEIPSIELCVTLIATQDTVENDSWDNQYDYNSEYPSSIKNNEGLYEALESSDNVTIKGGNYTLPLEVPANKTLNVEGGDYISDSAQGSTPAFTVGNDANLVISASDLVATKHNIAIQAEAGSTTVIKDGTYATSTIQVFKIVGNSVDETKFTIDNGTIEGQLVAIWCDDQNAIMTINGGDFDVSGIVMGDSAATTPVCITGGTFDLGEYGLGSDQSFSFNISGGEFTFADNMLHVMYSTVNISGGKFTFADPTASIGFNGWNITSQLVITGGTFNADPTQYVDTTAYDVTLNDGWYTVTAK